MLLVSSSESHSDRDRQSDGVWSDCDEGRGDQIFPDERRDGAGEPESLSDLVTDCLTTQMRIMNIVLSVLLP